MGTLHLLLLLLVMIKVQVNLKQKNQHLIKVDNLLLGWFVSKITQMFCLSGGSGPGKGDNPGKSLAHMTSVESDSSDR